MSIWCARHGAQRHDVALDNRRAKADREATCRVKVPMEALMTGTPSRTARASGAIRSLKEAEGKLPVRRTGIAYEAQTRRARGLIDSKPEVIRIASAYMRRICGRKVARLTLRDPSPCLWARLVARRSDAAAEVSRGRSSCAHSAAKGRTV